MKISHKIILLCLGASLGTLPALRAEDTPPLPANPAPGAPTGPRPDGGDRQKMREHMQERLIKELGLNADQQAKWQSLGQQERDAIQALRADTSLPKDQKREKAQEIRKNFEGQRNAVLTPDQLKKADELRAKMRERREHREAEGQNGQNGPPTPPPAPENK